MADVLLVKEDEEDFEIDEEGDRKLWSHTSNIHIKNYPFIEFIKISET